MFCLCSLLILTITLTSLTHPARPRRPLWFPGRMRNAQARHVMTSGSGDSGDVSSKTPRERNIWNEWKLHGNYMETTWKRCETLAKWSSHATTITWYVVIRCDTLWWFESCDKQCLDMPWHKHLQSSRWASRQTLAEHDQQAAPTKTTWRHIRSHIRGRAADFSGQWMPVISNYSGSMFQGNYLITDWFSLTQRYTKTTPCSRLPYCTQSSGVTVLDSKPRGNCCHIDDEGKLQQDGLASLRWDRHGPGMTWNPL
jgi:hypothetical protein